MSNKYDKLKQRINKRFPNVKIKYKTDNWFWKILPRAQRESATTLGNTIWMPHKDFNHLAHEYQHEVDIQDMGIISFLMMYLCPQTMSVFWLIFVLLSVVFGLKIFAIISACLTVLFLLPWPSPGRTLLEMRGYLMNLYLAKRRGADMTKFKEKTIDALRSPLYYKMIWTRKHAIELIHNAEKVLDDEQAIINTSVAFRDVNEILTETN
jgi:hypothetical protein